jgi:hypothetical protein
MRSLTCASLAATVRQQSASARSQGSQIVDSIRSSNDNKMADGGGSSGKKRRRKSNGRKKGREKRTHGLSVVG